MKKLISWILVIATISTVFLSLTLSASAESLYIRKIVSVVYDDSGSMEKDNKREYANYAMQAFCGMLNSEDRLFLTYMSEPRQSKEVDLSGGKIQESVDAIRNFKYKTNIGTPFAAVETAYAKLKSVSDPNANTQYWLVVITDGDFDACQLMGGDEAKEQKKQYLNDNLGQYMSDVMPNGSKPQLTFLGIGEVASPDEDNAKGIYTYSASDAQNIVGAMSRMADRISGRTRLKPEDIKQLDDKTIQVNSAIPLLNIAVLAQESKAKIVKAQYENEVDIPISRKVYLEQAGFDSLVGGAFLLGDTQKTIGVGKYEITFDQKVDASDLVVLFEPALELKITLEINGKETTDLKELDKLKAGDKLSVSSKIYEMGTTNVIDPKLLPPDTKFSAKITVDGKVDEESDGKDMTLSDYVVKEGESELKVSVQIDGFNPVEKTKKFKVLPAPPTTTTTSRYDYDFSISADYGSSEKSVKYDEIDENRDLTLVFTVFRDGKAMTDPEEVKKLEPKITFSPDGNGGKVTYSKDGKIVVTPNEAANPIPNKLKQEVEVSCTIEDEKGNQVAREKISYTVNYPDYGVVAIAATAPIVKTRFYNNKVSASFYIMKDGVQLGKSDVENRFKVSLNKERSDLKTKVDVSEDGVITVTPYSEKEYKANWLISWYTYLFKLPTDDVTITLDHELGKVNTTIDVVKEPLVWYELLWIYLPMTLEIALLLFLIWWAYAIYAKPKFPNNAAIYMAKISFAGGESDRRHVFGRMEVVNLKQYNALKYRLNPFTLKAKSHAIGKDLIISAGDGGSLLCHSQLWFKGNITPLIDGQEFNHPDVICKFIRRPNNPPFEIELISAFEPKGLHMVQTIDQMRPRVYYLHTKKSKLQIVDGVEVVTGGTIFAYANQINN